MRVELPKFSELLRRETHDRNAALATRPMMSDGSVSVLMVGNSLLLAGIDRVRLAQTMGPQFHAVLYPIENTDYLDWQFGLRRLFAEGARPSAVVLVMDQFQMLSDQTKGEEFAYSLMQIGDLPAVVRASHLDTMTTSAYFFSHFSALLGQRAHLRNGLLSRWLPNANELALHLTARNAPPMNASQSAVQEVIGRLKEMQRLCLEYRADFIYLVPPSLNPANPAKTVRSTAAQDDVKVLVPFLPLELPEVDFSDRYHLTSDGAELFTDRVARTLTAVLRTPGN